MKIRNGSALQALYRNEHDTPSTGTEDNGVRVHEKMLETHVKLEEGSPGCHCVCQLSIQIHTVASRIKQAKHLAKTNGRLANSVVYRVSRSLLHHTVTLFLGSNRCEVEDN